MTVGTVVQFKADAKKYNPTTKDIPNWVKQDYNHIVTQITTNGKPVTKGGKTCVLLGKKVKKSGGDPVAGVNTWTAVDNLTVVGSVVSAPKEQRTYTVKSGDTLWGIAKKELGSGARYTEIVQLNGLKTSTIYGGQKLIADCRAGKINKILVKSISRFARNTVDALNYIRELKELGISI